MMAQMARLDDRAKEEKLKQVRVYIFHPILSEGVHSIPLDLSHAHGC